jgi:hypothetical protein
MKWMMPVCAALCLVVVSMFCAGMFRPASAQAAEAGRIALPPPDKSGGRPLMEALALRATNRSISDKAVSDQDLSNLLWAVWGVNRPDGKRTMPTAKNSQDLAVYVARADGVWLYDGMKHDLTRALSGDFRAKLGGAPLTLLYAAPANSEFSGMHVGSLYQNAGLYCASAGLANVVKRSGADALDGTLKLPAGYRVFIVHLIGWPK